MAGSRRNSSHLLLIITTAVLDEFKQIVRTRIHDLRHSFATLATSMGEDIRILKDVLGHTKITTTEIYAHASSNAARRTANNIASMITG